jgi:hypothetical protein
MPADKLKDKFAKSGFKPEDPGAHEGHEDRFRARLIASIEAKHKKRILPLWAYIAAAACIAGLIFSVVAINIEKTTQLADSMKPTRGNQELEHIETWYTQQLALRKNALPIEDPELHGYMSRYSDLETEYAKLNELLKKDFKNERVIGAMIKNYQLRLTILENIKTHIELRKKYSLPTNSNNNSHV